MNDFTARPTVSFVVASTLLMWAAMGLAATTLWPIYEDKQFVAMTIVAIAAGSIIAIIGTVTRASSFTVLLATVGAFVLLGVPVAVPHEAVAGILPTPEGLYELVTGAALGWMQLLTISLPVGSYGALLVPAFTLILVVTVLSLSVLQRAPLGEIGAIGPFAVFIIGNLFGVSSTSVSVPITLAFFASIILMLIWRRWYRRRQAVRHLARSASGTQNRPLETLADLGFVGPRSLIAAALVFTLAAIVGVTALTVLPPTQERTVLRGAITQPFDPAREPSPLIGYRAYLKDPAADRTLFTVEGIPDGSRIRIATLDTYDGIIYSVGSGAIESASGTFTRVPYVIDQSDIAGQSVRARITIAGYEGVWLPTIGHTQRVTFTGERSPILVDSLYFNHVSSTAAVSEPLTAGDEYTVTAIVPRQPDVAELGSLEPAPVAMPRLDALPESLAAKLEDFVTGVDGAAHRLVAMIEGLKREGFVSHGILPGEPTSRSGHSADRITELVSRTPMIGDDEQYAVAAALMARELGFPARVVFGFTPEVAQDGPTHVTGSDVAAWIEVSTARYGWVAIDPSPPARDIPDETTEEPTTVARPQTPVQPPPPEQDPYEAQLPPATTQEDPAVDNTVLTILLRIATVLGWALVIITLGLSPFLTVAAAKWRRRRLRRKAPSPIARIAGGWKEFEDAVIDHGYNPPPSATRLEVAQTVGGTQPLVLASVVDRAVFSPSNPDALEAEQLWRSIDELRYGLSEGLTRWERLAALLSLRSLGGYSVSKLFRREVNTP